MYRDLFKGLNKYSSQSEFSHTDVSFIWIWQWLIDFLFPICALNLASCDGSIHHQQSGFGLAHLAAHIGNFGHHQRKLAPRP
jgi:hypothetical protein